MKRLPLTEWNNDATAELMTKLPEFLTACGFPEPTRSDLADILTALEPVLFTAHARISRQLDFTIADILNGDES